MVLNYWTMGGNLFDGARFGDRFLTKDGYVAIYQRRIECVERGGTIWTGLKEYTLHNLMTDDRVFNVDDEGKCVEDGIRNDSYRIVSRVIDDEDFIDAIAIKECPFDESEYADNYKAAFKNGFKKALNISIE